jgi:magnesium transporter
MHSKELPSDDLGDLLNRGNAAELQAWLEQLPSGAGPRYLTRLEADDQKRLLELLPASAAAQLLQELSNRQAAYLLSLLSPPHAAALFELFPSNEQADLLAEPGGISAAVLAALAPETARRAERLSRYAPDTAGGLMVAEYLSFPETASVADVIEDLRSHAREYTRLQAQYAYIVDPSARLIGVLRLRDLLLLDRDDPLAGAMTRDPLCVPADMPLDELLRFFDRHPYFGAPVVDAGNRLLGVALRADVEEASSERADRRWLLASGVLGGEEFRSMSWKSRVARRAPWLCVSLLLSLVAASVIGWYQETLAAAIALTVFLPVISGMGGNSGNQALAVSIRELSLGLVQPQEYLWVVTKEAVVGLTNGLLISIIVAALAWAWQRNLRLSAVVGIAIALNTLVAACLGGIVPLILKQWRLDPALASGPVLAAVNDMCGFLLALVLADWILPGTGP